MLERKLVALFVLGEKLSEDPYSDEDLRLLRTLADQTAVALDHLRIYEEMLQAQKQLLMADKLASLGRIAAGMAHEIKNPLSAVKGMTQAIDQNPDDPEILKDFKEIVPKEIDRLNNLVENLVRLGKPPKLQFIPVDVNNIIENTIKLFESRCRKKGISIIKNLRPLPKIKADPEQLTQVFTNLVLNAIQAMPGMNQNGSYPEGGELKFSTQETNGKIIIEVSDTGQGIPEDKLKDIFEPFFTTKEGMGLGLAITYKIIKDHGGEIEVESEVGGCLPAMNHVDSLPAGRQGTRFKIVL